MNEGLNALQQFHFLRPWWLAAALPAFILFLLLWRKNASAGNWRRVIAPHLLPHLLNGTQTRDSKTPLLLLIAAWLLASIALAGPTWQQLPAAVKKKIDARVIVFDLTLSMLAQDLPPSRLIRAKYKLSDILSRSKEGLTGLVVFAGTAHVVSPLTDDSNTILSLANSLTPEIMPISGSDPLAAITKAAEVLKGGGVPSGQILFIGDDIPDGFEDVLEPLKDTINLSVLAVGTADGAPIALGDGRYLKDDQGSIVLPHVNHNRLRQVATTFGGRYSALTADDADIDYLLADRLNLDDDVRETQREFDIWEDAGAWLALLILPLAAAGYRRGWLGVITLPLLLTGTLLPPTPAHADTWDTLWKNSDQQGKDAFDDQRFDEAAGLFDSPDWKAGALYKSGKYKEAEELYKKDSTATGHYNRGNALAQQGKLEESLSAYDEALKLNPGMDDAKENRKTVKRLLKKQKQQQNGDQGNQDKKDGQTNQDNKNNQDDKSDQSKDGDKDSSQSKDGNQQQNDQNQQGGNADQNNQENSASNQPSTDDQKAQDEQQKDAAKQAEQQKDEQQASENQADQQDKDAKEQQEESNAQNANAPSFEGKTEDQQAMEQWLRRVPDDPGGLLRRKFYYESRLRRNSENQNGTPW